MFISIPKVSTVKEFNRLLTTNEVVSVSKTSKNMDEYVYNKTEGVKNLLSSLALGVIDVFGYKAIKNNSWEGLKPYKYITAASLLALNISAAVIFYEREKAKQQVLNNPEAKRDLYKRKGINAVA